MGHEKTLPSVRCFLSSLPDFLNGLVLFRINGELVTCGNEDGYYGRLLFSTRSNANLMFLHYLTLFKTFFVSVTWRNLYTSSGARFGCKAECVVFADFSCSLCMFGTVFCERSGAFHSKNGL